MATLTRGITFGASETVTNTKLHNLVDLGAVSQIVDADCSPSMALSDTKLADITTGNKVRGTALGNLASIPSGSGVIPSVNIPFLGASMISLVSIPNSAIFPLTLTSWVDGSAMRNIQSMPSLAGQLSWYSIVSSLASGGSVQFNGVDKFVGTPLNEVSFLVRLTSTASPCQFDEVGGFDAGGNFSSNTFTAPQTGRYVFGGAFKLTKDVSGTARSPEITYRDATNSLNLHIISNTLTASSQINTLWLNAIVSMAAGQQMQLFSNMDSTVPTVSDIRYSYWYGYLLR